VIRELQPGDWRGFRHADFPKHSWAAAGGQLESLPARRPLDLITRDRFGDFVLSFEWRLPDAGNSGVLYRVTEEADQTWQTGPELQLLDDRQHPDGTDPLKSTGALYDVMASEPRLTLPPNVFHMGCIVVRDSEVEHWIAGNRVLTCDLQSRGVQHRIATSKFADCPLYACAREGHIALQHHGPGAAFRRLLIEG
jgi:hypothetical protein